MGFRPGFVFRSASIDPDAKKRTFSHSYLLHGSPGSSRKSPNGIPWETLDSVSQFLYHSRILFWRYEEEPPIIMSIALQMNSTNNWNCLLWQTANCGLEGLTWKAKAAIACATFWNYKIWTCFGMSHDQQRSIRNIFFGFYSSKITS